MIVLFISSELSDILCSRDGATEDEAVVSVAGVTVVRLTPAIEVTPCEVPGTSSGTLAFILPVSEAVSKSLLPCLVTTIPKTNLYLLEKTMLFVPSNSN